VRGKAAADSNAQKKLDKADLPVIRKLEAIDQET
jgi:hypothetical protein